WNDDRNAGFSEANPQKLYLPVIIDPEYKYESVNVATQEQNSSSLLWWMRRIINMRKRYKAFGRGSIKFLNPSNSKVLAFIRSYEDENILVIANLSRFPEAVELDLSEFKGHTPREVFSRNKFPTIKDDNYLFTIGGHGYYWFELQPQDEATKQVQDMQRPVMEIAPLQHSLPQQVLRQLESKVLPTYILNRRWFGGKARNIQRMQVIDHMPLQVGNSGVSWLLIEVNYNEGLPEVYQLPVAFVAKEQEQDLINSQPASVIARVTLNGQEGILYDALYSDEFRQMLLHLIAKRRRLRSEQSELVGHSHQRVSNVLRESNNYVPSRILSAEQSNTSIVYDNQFFLKIYRKLDRAMNPDVEVVQALTDRAGFPQVPKFLGVAEHHQEGTAPMVLAMLQELVPNQGDAWQTMEDSLKRFFERIETQNERIKPGQTIGSLSRPVTFAHVPESVQMQLGGASVNRIELLGQRTAEMHLALASMRDLKDFAPEDFSLHYQRSLYSSLTSLVRSNFDSLRKHLSKLPDNVRAEAEEVLNMRAEILERLKRIFSHKI
ncbi:MAG TPA: alpha-glucosidase C-terminal domain-containing protein, partial [Pontibacter sp.]